MGKSIAVSVTFLLNPAMDVAWSAGHKAVSSSWEAIYTFRDLNLDFNG